MNEIIKIFKNFLNQFNFTLISFNEQIFDNKKEMEIFDSINSRGMKLSLSDLIKNHIFCLCKNELLNNEAMFISSKYEEVFKPINKDYNNYFEILANYFTKKEIKNSIAIQFDKTKDAISKIIKFWKISSENENLNKDQYVKLVTQLSLYYKLYLFCYSNEDLDKNIPEIINLLELVTIFKLVRFKQWIKYFIFPLILFENVLLKKEKISPTTKNKIKIIFLNLIKWLLVKQINVGQGDSTLKQKIAEFFREFNIDELSKKENNEDIVNHIYNEFINCNTFKLSTEDLNEFSSKIEINIKSNELKSTILLLVEYYLETCFDENKEPTSFLEKDLSLEHIMPQNKDEWEKTWSHTYYIDKDKDEMDLLFDQTVNKIGNCLVISKKNNSKNKNYDFSTKKNNLKNCKSPLFKNGHYDDLDVFNKKEWKFEDIDKRTVAIKKIIFNFLKQNK